MDKVILMFLFHEVMHLLHTLEDFFMGSPLVHVD